MKGDGGTVLCRDKVVGRKFQLALLLPLAWCLGGAIVTFAGLLPGSSAAVGAFLLAMSAFFAFLWTTLSVIRTVVSDREVHVQYGLWGPRVPIEQVRSCRVVDYDWARFGGWGIKRDGEGTWAYVFTNGKVVELTWQEPDGTEKKVLFSASDPEAIVRAVQQARDESPTTERASVEPSARLRVEPDAKAESEPEEAPESQDAAREVEGELEGEDQNPLERTLRSERD